MADAGLWGRRQGSVYFGVGLERMRVAVAPSSERTYEGHFGAWVDFWVRCGLPVFLQHYSDSAINVWQLFKYVGYALVTKKLRSCDHRESLVGDHVFPSYFARFRD